MLKLRTLGLVAALTAIGIAPAAARWIDVGQARFGTAMDHARVDGPRMPVRALTLTARNNPMYCRSVRVRFGNGERMEVFSGRLEQGRQVNVDLPGRVRNVEIISLHCRATHNWAFVEIGAHTGHHRDRDRGRRY